MTDDFHVTGTAQDIKMSSAYAPCPSVPSKVTVDLDACTYTIQFPCVQIPGNAHRVITPGGTTTDTTINHEVGGYMGSSEPLPSGRCPHLTGSKTGKANAAVTLDACGSKEVDVTVTWDLSWPGCT